MVKLGGEYILEMLVIIDLHVVSCAFQSAEVHFVRSVTFTACFYGPERRIITVTEWCRLKTFENGSGQESCCG